jgi:hypothetical protein
LNEPLIIIIIVIFVLYKIAIFIHRRNAPKIKGDKGEYRIARRLNKLKRKGYIVLNDVLIETDRGSSQIDHVVVSVYGIFVIETKNYSGWIHGHENSEYWTQTIYKHKTKFRNPVRQNHGHIFALKKVLRDFKHVPYHPIIVFSGSAELKNVYANLPVIYDYELLRTIRQKSETIHLSDEQVQRIADRINKVRIHGSKEKKAHVRRVQNRFYVRNQRERSSLCPDCGGDLMVRQGRFGKFYGCSNYPGCRYTRKY